ncbi:Ykof family thiamine-binding protein [Halobacillus litoralis]|uniref:Ykof family thiamine-binding protein n=1 Tax=Halobacillus litoralis TaxID=45668 RepID=UPI001CD411C2|nr:Ykof family thiamine-binding protein [Halobacillus litoralis]MCA1022781.1 Ykof family thiamine-binding protein [Halobacillus litoralis]
MNHVCGTSKIAGCSFAIHPMSEDFAEIILDSLKKVDTSKVWLDTDDVTTTIRGRLEHIFDVTKAILLQVSKSEVHAALQATYSIGCPGDSNGDTCPDESLDRMNENSSRFIHQHLSAKFSLYPMGGGSYMDTIYTQIEAMKSKGVQITPAHYSTRLDGDTHTVFKGLEDVFRATEASGSSHTVMTVTVSVNSPSTKEVES